MLDLCKCKQSVFGVWVSNQFDVSWQKRNVIYSDECLPLWENFPIDIPVSISPNHSQESVTLKTSLWRARFGTATVFVAAKIILWKSGVLTVNKMKICKPCFQGRDEQTKKKNSKGKKLLCVHFIFTWFQHHGRTVIVLYVLSWPVLCCIHRKQRWKWSSACYLWLRELGSPKSM